MLTQENADAFLKNLPAVIQIVEKYNLSNVRIFLPTDDDQIDQLHFVACEPQNQQSSLIKIAEINAAIKKASGCENFLFFEKDLKQSIKDKSELLTIENKEKIKDLLDEQLERQPRDNLGKRW